MNPTLKSHSDLTHLGRPSRIPDQPNAATLERVPDPHADVDYVTRRPRPVRVALSVTAGPTSPIS